MAHKRKWWNGKWYVSRPIPSGSIQERIRDVLLVLFGKAEAVLFKEKKSDG